MEKIKFRVTNTITKQLEGYEELTINGWRYFNIEQSHIFTGVNTESGERVSHLLREQFSTFYEKGSGVELYVGDKISVADPANKAHKYEGTIVFHLGCFSLKISKGTSLMYDIGSMPPLYEFAGFKRI